LAAKHDPILVLGGGLASALALGRKGWRVRVLEQTPEFGAIGYGIQLGRNVAPMFDRLGVTPAVMQAADTPRALLMLAAVSGEAIVRVPAGKSCRARFKHPCIIVHRLDLHRVLLDACQPSTPSSLLRWPP
jgi:salicylate hydroxylase